MAREPWIAPDLRIRAVQPEECVEGYRAVRVATLNDPALPDSFRSHYEEGREPRYRQTQHHALHHAVSLWRDKETMAALIRKFPKLGGHVARVQLTFGLGFDYLDPAAEENPRHLTVWGAPDAFASSVVEIFPPDDPE